jgi:heme-degrading monooxygenase HmoA
MARIASFHLVREPTWKAPLALARLGSDRLRLRRTRGVVFWRLLGTGAGDRTGSGADLARTALFAVWDDETALDAFLRDSPVTRRWHGALESWHVRLRGVGGHGRWRGVDPLDGLEAGSAIGPVAIITRADVRRHSWKAFGAASNVVDAELHTAPGLIDVVGIGEAPVGRLATFSLWESQAAARTFAYSMPDHVEVMRRTRDEDWYAEEMFARFEPYGSSGTWNGRDPLAQ